MLIAKIIQENVTIEIEELMSNFQYSQNLEIQFIRDENYADAILTGWYKKHKEEERLLDIADDGTFTLPADIFTKDGSVQFSFALNYSDKVIHLGWVELYVKRAFGNTVDILPEEAETWISVVTRVAKNAIIDDVELVKQKATESSNNAKSALESANLAKTSADNASLSERKALEHMTSTETLKNNASSYADQAGASASNAAENATNASNSASNALSNANKAKEHLDNINTVVSEFNTAYTQKVNDFDNNYTIKKENFDTAVNSANTALNATITEANTSINNKVAEASAQANIAKQEADRATLATDGKLDKQQGAENAGKAMVVDEDGNVVPGSALPENVYTQQEVDYLLRDKMDKPYTDIEITEDTSIDCTMDGNFKINTISGNTVQNVEENIVPTPARPIPIVSKKTLVGGEYVELRSLKESVNLFDLGLQNQLELIAASGAYRKINVPLQLIPLTAYNFSYSQSDLPKQVWLVLNIIDSSGNILNNVIDNNNKSNEDITLSANTTRFTTTSDGKIFFSCYVGKWSEDLVRLSQEITIFKEYWYTKILKNIMLVEASIAPTSYIAPTVRDYKIVDHANKKSWIERRVGVNDIAKLIKQTVIVGDNTTKLLAQLSPTAIASGSEYSTKLNLKNYYALFENEFGLSSNLLAICVPNSISTWNECREYLGDIMFQYQLATPIIEEIEYNETDGSEVGSSFQDSMSPSPSIPSEIKGVSKINIKTVGKNMLKNDSWVEGYYLSGANGELLRGDKNITSNYIDIVSYTSYTISTNKNLHSMGYGIYDKDKQFLKFLSIGGKNLLVTSNEYEAKYIRVFFNINNTDNATYEMLSSYNPQLELGNTATNYEPYKESAINYVSENPLLKSNAVADIIDTNNLKRINNIVKQNINELNFIYSNEQNGFVRFYAAARNLKYIGKTYSNILPSFDTYDYIRDSIYAGNVNGGTTISIIVEKSKLTELTDAGLKNYINNPNAYVLYALSTPTEEPLPEDLINGLKELRTYSPVTNVFLEEEVKPALIAQYPKDLLLAQEKLEATVLTLQEEVVKNV